MSLNAYLFLRSCMYVGKRKKCEEREGNVKKTKHTQIKTFASRRHRNKLQNLDSYRKKKKRMSQYMYRKTRERLQQQS